VRVPDCHWPALRPSNKQVNLNAIRWRVCEPLHTCWGLSFGNFFEEDRRLHKVIAWVRSRHFAMQSSCSWVYNYDAVAAVETGDLGLPAEV